MKKFIAISLIAVISTFLARADEGIWLPILQKYTVEDMQKKGFKLTAEDLYDINHSSLKDAIVQFGSGCTGEVVSANGLLFTNHHCGYSYIQAHSSVEHNYLDEGFWANSYEEELPNEGLTVRFLSRMEDVSAKILRDIDDNTPENVRDSLVAFRSAQIEKEAANDGEFETLVKPIYYGNQYILYVYEVYKDIRLVGTPPDAIGKFGGDTDNWMWPRHTGDFSVFRIYADKDNKPAKYSSENKPFTPKKFLKVSLEGYNENDFTFIYGFPGHTQEYLPAVAVEMILKHNPHKIKLRTQRLNIINADMAADVAVRIKYASKQASIANAWKKWQGEYLGLQRLNAVGKKRELEKRFAEWIAADSTNSRNAYKNLLTDFDSIYSKLDTFSLINDYYGEAAFAPELISFAIKFNILKRKQTAQKFTENQQKMQTAANNFFKNYNLPTDKKIFVEMMKSLYNNTPREFHAEVLDSLYAQKNGNFEAIADTVYANTKLTNQDWTNDIIQNWSIEKQAEFDADIAVALCNSFTSKYQKSVSPKYDQLRDELALKQRLFMRGQMEMQPEKNFYPDANLTLRIAYGKVKGFEPVDGTIYRHYTTLGGVIEKSQKEDVTDYKIPERLAELYKENDFGRYANKDGKLPVAFLTSNHTTGGNSGSPILNANGELLGLNFDRCWESTMSDVMFDPDYCRNISVDIRYVLFLIDKYAGAKRLIDELDFAGEDAEPKNTETVVEEEIKVE